MTVAAVVSHARTAKAAPRKPPAKSRTHYGDCAVKCSGGNVCVCDSRPHKVHSCSEPDCPCHGQTVPERPQRTVFERVAVPVFGGNLDLWALMMRIGGKRVHPGVGRAPYAPRGRKNTG